MSANDATSLFPIRRWLRGAWDLLLPGVCEGCDADDVSTGGLCDACNVRLLSLVSLPYCRRCGSTLGPNIPARSDGCAGCPHPLPRFAEAIRLGPYTDPLRSVIREMKYRRRDSMRRRMGKLLAQAVLARSGEVAFDVVLPVPMHWRRRIARGCDHARVLAGSIASGSDLPLGDELIRIRNTPPQTRLSRTGRIENVRGAFDVRGTSGIQGARVLLVDDVTTTGATANEAARTLLASGANRVTLAVIAKAEPPTAYTPHWR